MSANRLPSPSRRCVLGLLASTPLLAISKGETFAQAKRNWTVTGQRVPELDGIDAAVQDAMRAGSIRAGALAIACKGKTLFERGYTWAEPTYPITRPNSPFRLASISKAFTAALTFEMVKAGAINLDTRAFSYLGLAPLTRPRASADPRLNDITVKQLIDHRSGLARDVYVGDRCCGPSLRDISRILGLHRVPTAEEKVRYMLGEALKFAPGTEEQYSNLGYDVLGLVCEKAARMDFLSALHKHVTGPHGIEVFEGSTEKEKRLPGEPFYDDPGSGATILHPDRNEMLPAVYGGDIFLEAAPASGGMVASAAAVARLIGHYAAWGIGPRKRSGRSGSQPGTSSWAESRGNGVDVAYVFNTRSFGNAASNVDAMRKQIADIIDDSHIGCEVTVFWDDNFKGDLWRTTTDRTRLEGGWNDQISSIHVTSGNWEFFEHDSFGGKVLTLGPGRYPRLIEGWNDAISSFRCVDPTLAR
jgi:CubicO group peptidase (beta-lactamase class C family)